ncbi:hypothetical protein G5B35_18100 [Parapusillimonas sp. SGNA-6]|uniref:hypothetical protein n=1 Tax=Parapedobacter sp. SGR-10 TaxID=2710879 RepID=UPI0013D84F68|nr:hypothetical protein [Parapedobacter sp. SGR-10]NGF55565.1 hypothetical protein [Parapedobacter sp. SGR-10]NGM89209.1 hypothetical protein [Parapusillimonas sp. SGNA-6]
MKAIKSICIAAVLLVAGCGRPELDKATALDLLKAENSYPRMVDYDIYRADPAHAKRVLDAGLEEKGMLTVQRTQKMGDMGKPLIHFTDAAKPYLLPTPEKDQQLDVQKVKLAEEVLEGIASVTTADDGKTATVEYTTRYTNFTPFNVLRTAPKDEKTHTVRFSLTDEGWKIERKR